MKLGSAHYNKALVAQSCGRLIASALRLHQEGDNDEARAVYQGAVTLHSLFASKLSPRLTRRLQQANNMIYFGRRR